MPGRRFRLLCIAGLLSVMLGAHVAPAATPEPMIRGPAWSRTSSTIVR